MKSKTLFNSHVVEHDQNIFRTVSNFQSIPTNERVYSVLASIPYGKVVSYGQLARLCGLGRGARVVAQVLRRLPKGSKLPWHRVVNAQGKISIEGVRGQFQQQCLEKEGVVFLKGKLSLPQFRWAG